MDSEPRLRGRPVVAVMQPVDLWNRHDPRREGIELTASFTATVNAEMRVGGIEETITVSGQAPTIDVQNVVQQRIMTRDVIDAIPTGNRSFSNLATFIPGTTTSNDVGGRPEDLELVKRLGADELVTRGPGFTDRVRALVPNGIDGLFDAALLNDSAVPAIANGGVLVTVRGWNGHVDRGIRVFPVLVAGAITDTTKLERLRDQAEAGVLTARVAKVVPASEAAEAHRLLEKGGIRGRLVLDFTQL